VTEALSTLADVAAAEEIFLTNSWLGIMPGASLEGRPLGERKLSRPLLTAYRKEVC
jgi:branched-subunit amino acid aminotransferase/4-amino-4-deoxychorismate lyase